MIIIKIKQGKPDCNVSVCLFPFHALIYVPFYVKKEEKKN